MLKLNLGCADRILAGYVNVDVHPFSSEVFIADLNEPWPWPDSSVEYVLAADIFEHLKNKIHPINELWRVLVPGGRATIIVPSAAKGAGHVQDPTHNPNAAWCMNSFQYFTQGSYAYVRGLTKVYGYIGTFKVLSMVEDPYQDKYEIVYKITAELEVVK